MDAPLVKTSEEKEKKGSKKKNVIDTPCKSNIDTVAEEHFSSKNTKTFWYCCQSTKGYSRKKPRVVEDMEFPGILKK